MKYAQLINILYNGDLSDILDVLNQAVYVTNFVPADKSSVIIHTGFTFRTQYKKMVLLYELQTEVVIKQVLNNHPSNPLRINGLCLHQGDSNFINGYVNALLFKAFEKDNNLCEFFKIPIEEIGRLRCEENTNRVTCTNDDGNLEKIRSFTIIETNGLSKTVKLNKDLNHRFYFNGSQFYLSAEDSRRESYDHDEEY